MRGIELLRSAGSNNAPTPVQKVRIYLQALNDGNINDGENCPFFALSESVSAAEPTRTGLTPYWDSTKMRYYVDIAENHYLHIDYIVSDTDCPICNFPQDIVYCHLDLIDAEGTVIMLDDIWEDGIAESSVHKYGTTCTSEMDGYEINFWVECGEVDCSGRGKYDPEYDGSPCDPCGTMDECGRCESDVDYGLPCEDDCGRTPDDPEYGQPCEEYDPCENLDECGRCEDDPEYGTPCDEEEEPEE